MPERVKEVARTLATLTAALLVGGLEPRVARAGDVTVAACVQANEQAGPLRRAGRLREARANLRLCSAQSCPGLVRKDCIAGATQADADVPTVAFSVQDADGSDLVDVKVSLDGQPLVDRLDGKAIDVDPGQHVFRFEPPRGPAIERRLVIVEGEKNRRERVLLGPAKPAVVAPPVVAPPVAVAPPPPPPKRNTTRVAGLALGGTGLGLLAAGGVAGLVATLEWSAAKSACGPTVPVSCKDAATASSDRSATMTAGTIADIALGVGGVALVTGAILVLVAPSSAEAPPRAAWLSVTPRAGAGTTGLTLQGGF